MKVETKKSIIIELAPNEAFAIKDLLREAIADAPNSDSRVKYSKELVQALEVEGV